MRVVGKLALMAFYFLLRVGEYMNPGRSQRRTKGFWLQDVKLFAKRWEVVPEQAHLFAEQIDTISLTIDNQKNGRQGDTLSHHALKDRENECCPVCAVVSWVIALVKDKAKLETPLCAFWDAPSLSWQYVRSKDMVSAVQDAIPLCGDDTTGYKEEDVGSHSLWSGGVTVLYINGYDTMAIQ